MSNKTCGNCYYFFPPKKECPKYNDKISCSDKACDCFSPDKISNGEQLFFSGMRTIAKAIVYGYRETDDNGQVTDGMLYTWHLPNAKVFTEYNEAVDYLEDWLNAPAGKDNNVHANESEGDDEP